jgi:hypothetical protein
MKHFESFEWTYPPIFKCFEASDGISFLKKCKVCKILVIWGFRFDVHFDLSFFFFRDLEVTYPPIFKCFKHDGAKTFAYTITIWKIWGGLTFVVPS